MQAFDRDITTGITGHTSLYCIIGMPAHHSLSPTIQNAAFKKHGIDAIFTAFDVPKEQLKNAVYGQIAFGIKGIVLTSPHKQAVMKYIDKIDKMALELGAVNTIINRNGKLYGYNTDEPGAVNAIKKYGLEKNAKYSIFGAGGAARAIAFGLAHEGVKDFSIINRTATHATELVRSLKKRFGKISVRSFELGARESISALKDSAYIINATNITLENKKFSPVNKSVLKSDMVIFDANYAPLDNKLISDAKAKGCTTINGLELLVYNQAVAFKLFTGQEADYDTMMDAALFELKKRKR